MFILNHLTMDYWNTMEEYILLDKVYFLVIFKDLPCQSPQLGNTGKYMPSRAGPIQDFSVLGQLYWAYIIPYCPVRDSVVAALRIHQRVRRWSLTPQFLLSTRTHLLWPKMTLSTMCYEGILNVEIWRRNFISSPSMKKHWVWGICSQDQARSSVRMLPNRDHVMPFHNATLHDSHITLDIFI